MKFTVIGYDIDVQIETDYPALSSKLTFLTLATFPEINVQSVTYDYDPVANIARIDFRRNSKSYLDPGWIKNCDCQLITGLDHECFIPKVYGGEDKGYFGLVAYAGAWYAWDDKVQKYFMDYLAVKDVRDVRFYFNDRHLEIRVIGD